MAFTKLSQHPYTNGVVVLVEDDTDGAIYRLRKFGHPHGTPVLQSWWEPEATAKAALDADEKAFNQLVKSTISTAVMGGRPPFDAWADTVFPLRRQPDVRAALRVVQRAVQENVEG